MIEPNDYEMCKHMADMVLEGASESDLQAVGYLRTDESRLCYAAALERPKYWSNLLLETEAAGCMPSLGDEWLERNKDWFVPR
jgi:hypothetical protein